MTMMKWTMKDVTVNVARVCGYSGCFWLYYKCLIEGRPPSQDSNGLYVPREFWAATDTLYRPFPMVDKLEAFISKMMQMKKNDEQDDNDDVFHRKPNNLSPLGLHLVSHTSCQQENEPVDYF